MSESNEIYPLETDCEQLAKSLRAQLDLDLSQGDGPYELKSCSRYSAYLLEVWSPKWDTYLAIGYRGQFGFVAVERVKADHRLVRSWDFSWCTPNEAEGVLHEHVAAWLDTGWSPYGDNQDSDGSTGDLMAAPIHWEARPSLASDDLREWFEAEVFMQVEMAQDSPEALAEIISRGRRAWEALQERNRLNSELMERRREGGRWRKMASAITATPRQNPQTSASVTTVAPSSASTATTPTLTIACLRALTVVRRFTTVSPSATRRFVMRDITSELIDDLTFLLSDLNLLAERSSQYATFTVGPDWSTGEQPIWVDLYYLGEAGWIIDWRQGNGTVKWPATETDWVSWFHHNRAKFDNEHSDVVDRWWGLSEAEVQAWLVAFARGQAPGEIVPNRGEGRATLLNYVAMHLMQMIDPEED